MEYQIKKHVLIPPKRRWSRWASMVASMEAGDSVEFKDVKELPSCRKHMRDRGYGTAQRQLEDGVWCLWRTE